MHFSVVPQEPQLFLREGWYLLIPLSSPAGPAFLEIPLFSASRSSQAGFPFSSSQSGFPHCRSPPDVTPI